jgi:hypothetical protein
VPGRLQEAGAEDDTRLKEKQSNDMYMTRSNGQLNGISKNESVEESMQCRDLCSKDGCTAALEILLVLSLRDGGGLRLTCCDAARDAVV